MSTFASNLAHDARKWTVYLQIEGVGEGLNSTALAAAGNDGRARFSSFNPAFASAQPAAVWRPLLTAFPELLSERGDPNGSAVEAAGITFSVLDGDDYLTERLRTERPPVTALGLACDDNDTSLTFGDTSAITKDEPIFIGAEALLVTEITGPTTADVSRGYLGTRAGAHANDDRVFLSTPYVEGRRVVLCLAPLDATDPDEAVELATYVVTGRRWDRACNVLTFQAKAQSSVTNRIVPYAPRQATVEVDRSGTYRFSAVDRESREASAVDVSYWRQWLGTESDPLGHLFYVRDTEGGEVVSVEGSPGQTISSGVRFGRRPLLGGALQEFKGGEQVSLVFCAEPQANSFRLSPGPSPSTSRSSGSWLKVDNPIDIFLCVATSSHHQGDGLELTNYRTSGTDAERSNWSCLPAGYGAGIRTDELNIPGLLELRQRTLDVRLPKLVFGDRREPFGMWAQREILRPLGAYFSVVDGVLDIVLPATPLADAATITLGSDDILAREVSAGVFEPRLELEIEQNAASSMELILGPSKTAMTITNARYAETFGQSNVFDDSGQPIKIEIPGADDNDIAVWERRMVGRLWRAHRPRFAARGDFDFGSAYDWRVGALASLTLAELPNHRDSTRGVADAQLQSLERVARIEGVKDGLASGLFWEQRAQVYGSDVRVGRRTPAAHVVSNAGAIATCTANRYTHSDAAGSLPSKDVSAFAIGDECKLVDAAGVEDVSSGTETIVDIDPVTNEIEFTGDFNGNLGPDGIIVFADSGDATSNQLARYAFYADRTNQTIGASNAPPWVYGEP